MFFKLEIVYILIDSNKIFPMKPSEFRISISVVRYNGKTAENYRNCFVFEIALNKTSKVCVHD